MPSKRAQPPEPTEPPDPTEPQALRLTFAYDGNGVRLVSQERVPTLPPPDDSELVAEGQVGYRLDVRDSDGQPIYRRVLHDPIPSDMEVFSPGPDAPIERVPVADPEGVFQVVVPDLPGAVDVALHGPESPDPAALMAEGPLVTARLRDPKQQKGSAL